MNTKDFHIVNVPFPMLTCLELLLKTLFRSLHNGANKLNFNELYRRNKHEQGIQLSLCCIIMLMLGQ